MGDATGDVEPAQNADPFITPHIRNTAAKMSLGMGGLGVASPDATPWVVVAIFGGVN